MRRGTVVLAVAGGLVGIAACGDKIAQPLGKTEVAKLSAVPAAAPAPPPMEMAQSNAVADRAAVVVTRAGERKIIRNTALSLQVRNAEVAIALVDSIARRHDIVIGDAQVARRENKRQSAHYVLHVPAPEFDATLDALRALGEVQRESGAAEDITKTYTDLETRIAVKESTVRRLQALLATHTAKLSEVLDVEREIARAVTELEQMKGERRFYDTQVASATITVDLFEPYMVGPTRVTPRVGEALQHSLEIMSESAATAAYFIAFMTPWAVLASIVIWISYRLGFVRWPIVSRRHILPS